MIEIYGTVIYSAGPMRGIEMFNFPAFDAARENLRAVGYTVICPAEMDRRVGLDPATGIVRPEFIRETLARDLQAIALECNAMSLLPGWEDSAGVALELHLARFLGLDIRPLNEWFPRGTTNSQ